VSELGRAYLAADTSVELWEVTVGGLLADAAADSGEREALCSGSDDRRWTYAALDADADLVAGALAGLLDPGDRLAVWSTGLPEWIVLQFAAARAGVVLVPLNPVYRAGELSYALRQSRARAVFHGPPHAGRSLASVIDEVRPDCPELEHVLELEPLLAWAADAPGKPLPVVEPTDPVMIQYTSGTTGRPKGAVLTHRGIANNARLAADRCGVAPGGVWLNPLPLFHTGGCVFNALGALANRGLHVLMPVWDAGAALELTEREGVTFLCAVPTMLLGMIEHPSFTPARVATLRNVAAGGTTIPPDLVRRFETALHIDYTMIFGQTEAGPTVCGTFPDDTPEDKSSTIGRPLPHTEVRIVHTETGEVVGYDEPGEICLRGFGRMLGYFELPEETEAAIDRDGWLHTGDLGRLDERGYLKITGRLKEIIRRGGETISPRAIEDLLFGAPGVGEVAVVGVPDERLGEQVAAFVQPAAGGPEPDLTALRELCAEHLSPYKVPRLWGLVEQLPRTPSGKVQKFALRDGYLAGEIPAERL
jgi:fatty-acyl-CoA synthase